MRMFAYKAIDARGVEKSGRQSAVDGRALAEALRGQGWAPIEIVPAMEIEVSAGDKSRGRTWTLPGWPAIRRKEVAVFTRQLGTLLRAGLPLLRGLETLSRQERNLEWRRLMAGLSEEIRNGGTLSVALARHPRIFDRLYVNMIKAGEAGGSLAVVLERLARFLEKSQQLRSKVRAAMIYPLLVLLVAAGILAGLLVFVVPKFEKIYADLLKGAPLPPLTRWVMEVSVLAKDHLGAVVLGGALLAVGARVWLRTERGRLLVDAAWLRVPGLGELLLKGVMARLARTFGTLLSSGVPLLPALLISRDACANARVAAALTVMHQQIKEGATVAAALGAAKVFPPLVTSLVDVGEHTGELPEMLGRIADIYDEEVDHAVAGLSSLIEPLLILLLALVVGTIVIALFLPIIRIVQLMT